MRKTTLTILLVAIVAAAWAQKPDKKTAKLEKQLVGTFVEVPAGHFMIRNSNGDTTWVTIAGFRMLETEVTNASYNLFLDDLKSQGRMADYEKARDMMHQKRADLPAKGLLKLKFREIYQVKPGPGAGDLILG